MDKLEEKYRNSDITLDELVELRANVSSMSDNDLEQRLHEDWQSWEPKGDDTTVAERLAVVKSKVDRQLFGESVNSVGAEKSGEVVMKRPPRKLHMRWGWIAAAVMIPFLMLTTLYFYRSASSMESGCAVFATAETEQAGVRLPDGTVVTLNSSSNLTYAPKVFNTGKRNIEFTGEAYFDVSKNKDVPFYIHSGDMTVKVLGTKFNFEAYPDRSSARLSLDEGKVEISSGKEKRSLVAGQVAVLNYNDGAITVSDGEKTSDASAWKNREMIFRSSSLDDVVEKIEQTYKVNIHMDKMRDDDTFSGNIPTDDLVSALEIVKISYGLNYRIDVKDIYFSKKM